MFKRLFFLMAVCFTSPAFAVLSTPTSLSPATGTIINRFDVLLYCYTVTGATGYEFIMDSVSGLNSPYRKFSSGTGNYFSSPTLKAGKTYYWKARAFKSGDTSLWTSVINFSVQISTYQLVAPANNSVMPPSYLLSMNMGSDSTIGYQFEADTSSQFNSTLYKFFTTPTNTCEDSSLITFGRTIFWRARSFNNMGDTTAWSTVWKFSVLTVPTINGSTGLMNIDPKFTVSWTSAGRARIELQCDSLLTFNSPGLMTQYNAMGRTADTLRDLLFGKYYFYRIRLVYGSNYSGWSVVRNTKVYGNGNINNPYSGETIGLLNNIYFSWRSLAGTRCQFQLYADPGMTQLLKDTLTNLNQYSFKGMLELATNYYFRVRYFHDKDTAVWLSSYFKTFTGQVNQGEPYNQVTNQAVRLRFSFRKQTWGVKHIMEIDTGVVITSNHSRYFIQTDTFKYDGGYYHYIDTLLGYGKRYVWRVYAITAAGDTAEPATRTFTTLSTPVPYYPPNHMIGMGTQTNGLVTGIKGSDSMDWQLDTSAAFNSPLLVSSSSPHIPDVLSPTYVNLEMPGELRFHTTYYWRSRCRNKLDTGTWSATWDFYTTQEVWAISPVDRSVNLPLTQTIKWGIQGSNFDYRYQYQAGTDSLFTTVPIQTLPVDALASANLFCNYGTTYFWRARAAHAKDTSHWSPVFRFRTLDAPVIGKPNLLNPANGSLNIVVQPLQLTWTNTSNANSYEVQFSTDSGFVQIAASGNSPFTNVTFANPAARTKYWWHVRGANGTLTGPWSNSFWFQTGAPIGLEELGSGQQPVLFPNPVADELKLELPELCSVIIIDGFGKKIGLFHFEKGLNKMSVSDWKEGIYFAEIIVGERIFYSRFRVSH